MPSHKIGSYLVIFGASRARNEEETSAQVAVVVKKKAGRALAARVGWGFDDDLPLRPWPSYALTTTRTSRDLCMGCFGFYVGFSRELPHE